MLLGKTMQAKQILRRERDFSEAEGQNKERMKVLVLVKHSRSLNSKS